METQIIATPLHDKNVRRVMFNREVHDYRIISRSWVLHCRISIWPSFWYLDTFRLGMIWTAINLRLMDIFPGIMEILYTNTYFFYIPMLSTWNGIHFLSDCIMYLAAKQLVDFHMLIISLKNCIIYSCIGITALNKKYIVSAFIPLYH